MDVGQDASRRNGHATEQLVELFVILDGQGNVAGNDAALFVVAGGVSGQFEDFRAEVLEYRRPESIANQETKSERGINQ